MHRSKTQCLGTDLVCSSSPSIVRRQPPTIGLFWLIQSAIFLPTTVAKLSMLAKYVGGKSCPLKRSWLSLEISVVPVDERFFFGEIQCNNIPCANDMCYISSAHIFVATGSCSLVLLKGLICPRSLSFSTFMRKTEESSTQKHK